MNIDPLTAANLVTRQVRTDSRNGESTRSSVARRTYATDQADLWDAVTNQERLPRWFAPVTGDLTLGGRFQVVGNAGGVIEECDKPNAFAVTWEFAEQMSWLRVRLTAGDDGTTLEIEHEATVSDHWDEYGPGAVGVGWDFALLGLALNLESGEPVDREAATTFTFSPEGRGFVQNAAAAWAEAAIADGDDPDAARAAGERTLAFYTTAPES